MFLSPSVPTLSTPLYLFEFSQQVHLWKAHAKAHVLKPFGAKSDHK